MGSKYKGQMIPPTYSSHRRYPESVGYRFEEFSKHFLTATKGFKQGQPLEFAKYQSKLFEDLFELNPEGYWRYRQAVIGIPRKNGKSLQAVVIVLFCLLFGGEGVEVYSAATSREQAAIIFREAANQIRRNVWLQKYLKVTREGIFNPSTGGVYKAIPAEGDKAQGLGPLIVVADEVGEWSGPSSRKLWSALTEGSGDRKESMVIAITAAGYNPESLLGELYKHGRRVSLPVDHEDYIDDEYFGFFWWEAPKGCDIFSEDNWYLANPSLAEGLLDIEDFKRAIANPTPFNIATFRRYRLNQWVRIGGVEFISNEIWQKAVKEETIKKGSKITLGFDGSQTGDSTAIVAVCMETGMIEVMGLWENKNATHGWYVNKDEVFERLKNIAKEYDIQQIWADPSYFQQDLIRWGRDLKLKVVSVPANQMAKWAQRFTSAIIYGEIFHANDPDLNRHVFNAVLREDGSFQKISKQSKEKIDLLVSATLANAAKWFLEGRRESTIEGAKIH